MSFDVHCVAITNQALSESVETGCAAHGALAFAERVSATGGKTAKES